ncbi:MAG: hypothetical protein H6830_08170 [Planctomycetes bacterium]|nr:hypothetical protein [Planctomycetota bacterium]HRV80016.1 hypothetical protein [Planctomycetota bacterium]
MPQLIMRIRTQHSSRRGAALISALMLVAAVATLGAGLVQVSSVSTRRQNLSIDTVRALYVAEAALSEAYFAVAQGRGGTLASDTEPAEFGGGFYWVEAEDLPDKQVRLTATGLHGRGKFTLGLVLNRSINRVAAMGVCGLKDVTIGPGAVVDSQVSDGLRGLLGQLLSPLQPSVHTNVRSNGDITIYGPDPLLGGSPTTIRGNVHAGPEGIVDADPSVLVTGAVTSSSRGLTLPTFTIPKLGGSSGNFTFPKGKDEATLAADSYFDTFSIPAGKTVTLQGPMRLRADSLLVGTGARLIIDTTNGPIGIYTLKRTIFEAGSMLDSVVPDPTQCSIFALTPDENDRSLVTLGAKGEFYGMLVAPRALVNIPGDLHMVGSVVAESLYVGPAAQLSYAEDLEEGGYGVKMTPTLISWQILEVPDSPLTRGPGSIDEKLQKLAIPTVPTKDSPLETDVELKYYDNGGVFRVYTGPVAAVPWGNVLRVDRVAWYIGATLQPEQKPSIVIDAVDTMRGTVDAVVKPLG